MEDSTFQTFAALAARITGQSIPADKSYLVEARLSPIVRREGFATMEDLAACLGARPNPVFELEIAAALTGKQTCFFDDRATLARIVEDVIPAMRKERRGEKLRLWIAGGATGQEAFSLAMLLDEAGLEPGKVDILCTDVSKALVERARSGVFGHFEVQKGLSIHRLLKYFRRRTDGSWEAVETLRGAVSFRQHNLMDDMSGLGKFDLTLCRNVLTDIGAPARRSILTRLSAQLNRRGLLFIGARETLSEDAPGFRPSRSVRGAYEAEPPGAVAAA